MPRSSEPHSCQSNVFLDGVPQELRDRVLAEAGVKERRGGKLPRGLVLQLVIAMAFRPHLSIPSVLEELVEVLGEPLSWRGIRPQPSSITAARDRLGWRLVRELFRLHSEHADEAFGKPTWRGFRVAAVDGTTQRVPDSPENAAAFGRPGGRLGPSGFPAVRLLALVDAYSHQVRAAVFGPIKGTGTGELSLARDYLLDQVPVDTVLLFDRGFCAYSWLSALWKREIPFVVRLKTGKNSITPNKRKTLLRGGDWDVDFPVPNSFRPRASAEELPLRMIKWTTPKRRSKRVKGKAKADRRKGKAALAAAKKSRGRRQVWLLTNLVDDQKYPRSEIVELYLRRWEVEFAFRELKSTLTDRKVDFRSKKPERIMQESYALLLAYNVTRLRILQATVDNSGKPTAIEIGFKESLQAIRRAYIRGTALPDLLKKLASYVIEKREPRRYPRQVKCRSTRYPTKPNAIAA